MLLVLWIFLLLLLSWFISLIISTRFLMHTLQTPGTNESITCITEQKSKVFYFFSLSTSKAFRVSHYRISKKFLLANMLTWIILHCIKAKKGLQEESNSKAQSFPNTYKRPCTNPLTQSMSWCVSNPTINTRFWIALNKNIGENLLCNTAASAEWDGWTVISNKIDSHIR